MVKDEGAALPYNEAEEDEDDPSNTMLVTTIHPITYVVDKSENTQATNRIQLIQLARSPWKRKTMRKKLSCPGSGKN